ncbi:hypothetical protein C8R44DRAFT_786757 [Mycena epipterygia]|nr:hypothetical protein C8R44DRAFT_786757 [Mycena epipterygia]
MKCEKIRRKKDFKRCSSCWAVYYCSTACQALDWYEDGHRDVARIFEICVSRNRKLSVPEIGRSSTPWYTTTTKRPSGGRAWTKLSSCTTTPRGSSIYSSTTPRDSIGHRSALWTLLQIPIPHRHRRGSGLIK